MINRRLTDAAASHIYGLWVIYMQFFQYLQTSLTWSRISLLRMLLNGTSDPPKYGV